MLLVILLVLLVYCFFILWVAFGSRIDSKIQKCEGFNGVSLLIPYRNEAHHLIICLEALLKLDVQNIPLEIIFIDDHSNDSGRDIIENYKTLLPLRCILSDDAGKKAALMTGVSVSKYNTILTLDADCTMDTNWLQILCFEFKSKELNMLCGPVELTGDKWFQCMQNAESAAIVGISMRTVNANLPSTCNGANLMFNKQVFLQLGAYDFDADVSSGDDDLLMHKFCQFNINKVAYCTNIHAKVQTQSIKNLKLFLYQRARWLSKSKHYLYPYNKFLHLLLASKTLGFFAGFIYLAMHWNLILLLVLMFVFVIELFFSLKLKRMFKVKFWQLLLMPIYSIYILPAFILTLVGKIPWKGRIVKA